MFHLEEKNYKTLNELAEHDGIVILGGSNDMTIPLCELKQAFSIESNLYNRSFRELSIDNAIEIFDSCIAPLEPETVILHIGEADLDDFAKCPSDFDKKYFELITHIKDYNKKCKIAIISVKNENNSSNISELNKHLKYISQCEHCEFGDISSKRVWNPQGTKDTLSFIYSMGFVRPLKNRQPLYDLVKILFCYEQPCM